MKKWVRTKPSFGAGKSSLSIRITTLIGYSYLLFGARFDGGQAKLSGLLDKHLRTDLFEHVLGR